MPLIRTVQTNFSSGAISPSARDRIDLANYRNAVKTLTNWRTRPLGGVTRRPGAVKIAKVTYSDCQIEPFVFDSDEAYAFIFYNLAVDIYNKHTRAFIATIAGPWTTAQVLANELNCTQALDKIHISHPDFETRIITRTAAAAFSIATIVYTPNANGGVNSPFHKYAASTITITPSGTTGAITLTASAAAFVAGHVGTWFRIGNSPLSITGYGSSTVLNATVGAIPVAAVATYDWTEQMFSSVRGWARSTGLHEGRFWFGGSRDAPNTLSGSTTSDPYSHFIGTALATDAIKETIRADRVAEIKAIVSFRTLQIFTADGEFYAPSPQNSALSPTNISFKQQSGYGCSNARPRRFDQTTIFISRVANSVREFVYDDVQQSYAADSLTFAAAHLINDPVDLDVMVEGQATQEALAFLTNGDGTLAVLSKVRKENIGGWGQWTTQGSYKRLGVVDREAWVLVERTVNSVVGYYLEVFDEDTLLDFATRASGASSATWGPYTDYANQAVHVRSANLYFGQITVSDTGYVVLPIAVTEIEIGYNFVPTIVPLNQEVQMPDGTSFAEPRRYVSVTASLVDTLSYKRNDTELPNGPINEDPGAQPVAYNGRFRSFLLGWGTERDVTVTAPYPLPTQINALSIEVEL